MRRALRARRLLEGDRLEPRDGGWVVIEGERIVEVRTDAPADVAVPDRLDLGDAILAPGFVNAHTHLELSHVPYVGVVDFASFLQRMRAYRGPVSVRALAEAAADGARECLATGTTAVVELATSGESAAAVASSGLEGVLCAEVLGLDPGRIDAELGRAMEVLSHATGGLAGGIFLHAPYSVGAELRERARRYAAQARLRLATHLLESPDELALLSERRGSLWELVRGIGIERFLPPTVPLDELVREHARADTLLVHLASCPEAAVEAIPAGSVAALCPRSNASLSVGPAPFAALERRGVTLALGTDSRASAPSLDMREEMRAACAAYGISPRRAIEMATIAGAAATGASDVGVLAPGARASFVAIEDRGAPDPWEALLDPAARVLSVHVSGRAVERPSR